MRLTFHTVHWRSHCHSKYVKESSLGTFPWREPSAWEELDVRLGASDMELKGSLTVCAWRWSECQFLMSVGPFGIRSLWWVFFNELWDCFFFFFNVLNISKGPPCALPNASLFVSQKEGYHMLGLALLKTKRGSQWPCFTRSFGNKLCLTMSANED